MAALAAAGLYKLTTTASVVRVSSRVSLSLAATGVAGAVEKSHSRVRDIGGIATKPVVKGAGARTLCWTAPERKNIHPPVDLAVLHCALGRLRFDLIR